MNPSLPNSMLQDVNKMKGDAIGDTMYSGRWVLKTLMKLSQKYSEYSSSDDYQLEEDLEGDLGLLWDMTIEPDVALFLQENSALELISDIISYSCSPRMTEIMIGILGNLACQETVRRKIARSPDLIKVIINLLKFTDSPTLIQLVRLMKTCLWNVGEKPSKEHDETEGDDREPELQWIQSLKMETDLLYQSLIFILSSARNDDLLCSTLGLMESLFNVSWYSDDYFCKCFSTEEFIKALMEAANEIVNHVEDKSESLLNNRKVKEAFGHWVSLLHRLTYHNIGMDALEKQAEAVFILVNSIWIEQSSKFEELSTNHKVHLTLAVELLAALLPSCSQVYRVGNILSLLSTLSEEDFMEESRSDEMKEDNFKDALENLCFQACKNWKVRSQIEENDWEHYSEEDMSLLLRILMEKLGNPVVSQSDTANDSKLLQLKNIIASIPIDDD